jgi:hypothetical protein
VHTAVLIIHVAAGTAALALGPLFVLAARRGGRRHGAGVAYQGAVGVLCASAIVLVAFDLEGLWWLAPIAVATQVAALGGAALARRRPAWRHHLWASSYIALLTALLVVSWGSPLAWVLPVVVARPLVVRAAGAVPA